ncbi:hypothetical protein Amet_2806 [Alkaliphilus metalliredigens QYMF]|uniref:Uncharacterized protein n=1 Tax=Alkaliphilus metalliredigens (strain QYMF) TaxID=293826 RepID=A6TRY8_ALKMQ|nr:hypothetical protein [Alkaliphilus metalliredigens]ABR48956.1 hypothetical protein Amet_2806 [Alkaliphilus metalliredigens QYMF]
MTLNNVVPVLVSLFVICFVGYVFTVLKEKYYLKNNVVYIENKNIEPKILDKVDIRHFMLGAIEIMAGDEIKVSLDNSNKLSGTVLGANKKENTIILLLSGEEVEFLNIKLIKKLKVISRYGKFFNTF